MAVMDDISEDQVMSLIAEGLTQSKIAARFGFSRGAYINWMTATQDRPARIRAAMMLAARAYADAALDEIDEADDVISLAKAREKASHYRWLSSKYDRALYGDKLEVSGDLTVSVQVMAYDVAGKLQVVQDISKHEDKQALISAGEHGLMGGVVSAGPGVAVGNPRSTASHSNSQSSHPNSEHSNSQDESEKPLSKRKQKSIENKRRHRNVAMGGGSDDVQDVVEKDTNAGVPLKVVK